MEKNKGHFFYEGSIAPIMKYKFPESCCFLVLRMLYYGQKSHPVAARAGASSSGI